MVRTRALMQHDGSRPDPVRVAAISAAIIVNLTLFAVLMRPINFAEQTDTGKPVNPAVFVIKPVPLHEPPLVKVTPKPPPVTPPVTTQVRVKPTVMPQPTTARTETSLMSTSTQPTTSTGTDTGDTGTDTGPPVEMALTPIASPAPPYPHGAIIEDRTGTVWLLLLVDTDGHVLTVNVERSSGDRRLDNAARDQVLRNWMFQPATRNGVAVRAMGRVPIVFKLDGQ